MISLKIQNLVLIEKAEITFGPGLNILTGETGSGKSAILSAISLITGSRADSQMIRKGANFAVVEALIGDVHIRREIYRSGKNRSFIDDSQVSLSELKGRSDFEMVDQSSSLSLNLSERQTRILDTFAGITDLVDQYNQSVTKQKELEIFLQEHNAEHLEKMQSDLIFIEDVNILPGEEEKLNEEHRFLTAGSEILEKIGSISSALSECEHPVTLVLKKLSSQLDQCTKFDHTLLPTYQSLKGATLEIEEIAHFLSKYVDRLEVDPSRLGVVEKRIAAIEALKKRFGPNIDELRSSLATSINEMDTKIQEAQTTLEKLKKDNELTSQKILDHRLKAAPTLSLLVMKELQSLNIPHAKFEIIIQKGKIEFLFSANAGQKPIPLDECASGGELSRLLLALTIVLGSGTSTLVFDEIDSNVGGQTATILGEKLKQIGEKRQVICVTHFVQVAKCAMDHFLVEKVESQEAAYTQIIKLDRKAKEGEYNRMLGNHL